MKRVEKLRKASKEELRKRISELRLELMKEKGKVKMGRAVKNPGRIRNIKREIARILTIIRERGMKGG